MKCITGKQWHTKAVLKGHMLIKPHMEQAQKLLQSCFKVAHSHHPHPTKSLLSLKPHPHLWPQVCEWQLPSFSPSLPKSLTHFSSTVCLSQTLPPLALTQAYCLLSAARPNRDSWLVAEAEKEALGVFIESLSFTRTITTPPPHQERGRLTFGFTS